MTGIRHASCAHSWFLYLGYRGRSALIFRLSWLDDLDSALDSDDLYALGDRDSDLDTYDDDSWDG